METGFGSPQWQPMPEYQDFGFGSSTTGNNIALLGVVGFRGRDTGFGSPFVNATSNAYLQGDNDVLPDSGNVTLRIYGEWSTFVEVKSPVRASGFKVFFINSLSGNEYQGIGMVADSCMTTFDQNFLEVRVPPLPVGSYGIRIECPTTVDIINIDNAFRTVVSPRCESTYAIRSYMPVWLNKGAVDFGEEVISSYTPDSNLASIISVVGEALQSLGGRSCTATTQKVKWGDSTINVESTLGFPASGSFFLSNSLVKYTAKTDNTFTGCTYGVYFDELLSKERVVHHVHD